MATRITDFRIDEIVYDSHEQLLTYNLIIDGNDATRHCSGFTTAEEVAEDFKKILEQYYAKT